MLSLIHIFAQRHIRQIPLEIILGLLYQGGAVGQEKNIGDPPAAAEHIGQAGGGSCFSRAGCHHQQLSLIHIYAANAVGLLALPP